MQIAFEDGFTDEKINEVVLWLFQDNYKPLFFEDKEDRLFYCIAVGDSSIAHNGLKEGYITISMRCDSPYVYSNVYVSEEYNLSTNTIEYPITLENKGHFNMFPEISIRKIGTGHITITNISNGGEIFEIRDLTNLEEIYINSEKETINTDIIGVYRYDKVIGNYLELPYGKNIIKVKGKCMIQFRYQYKYKF
jgi:phage-related protein